VIVLFPNVGAAVPVAMTSAAERAFGATAVFGVVKRRA